MTNLTKLYVRDKLPQMAKSILIADDHAFTLQGMQLALSSMPGFTLLEPVHSGVEAIKRARKEKPDIAILDYAMPDASGLEVFHEIRRWSPDTRCLFLTGNSTPAILAQLLASGAHGVFLKSTAISVIHDAILQISVGQFVHGEDVTRLAAQATGIETLTQREIEVLSGIAKGLSNPGIASTLSISPKTVESHRASLMRKLEVRSTAALLVRAMRLGLVN